MRKLTVMGAGPGSLALLTGEVRAAMAQTDLLLCTPRLHRQLGALAANSRSMGLPEIFAALDTAPESADWGVLVSGDVGFYSLAASLQKRYKDRWQLCFLPGISSLQLLCARLGVDYQDTCMLSAHGRDMQIVPWACYNRQVFALTGGVLRPQQLCAQLQAAGLGKLPVTVGEDLALPSERITTGTAAELAEQTFGDLSVMLVQNPNARDPARCLHDSDFVRGAAPMTKEPVRALCLAYLEVAPGDCVYDIGAGTGSVAVSAAYRACRGTVYALERDPEALALLRQNIAALGAYNVVPVDAEAPDKLAALPPPNAVFIGGSGGKLGDIIDQVLLKNPAARLVITAITLETLQRAIQALQRHDIEPQITSISAANAKKVGASHMMMGQNPVYIISGRSGR